MGHDLDEGLGGEYDTVSFDITWSGVSVALFLLDLPTPYLVRLQPWRPQELWMWPLVTPLVLGVISSIGLLCGLIALKVSANKTMAKVGVLTNGVVVGLIVLLYVVMRMIIGGR